MPYTSSGYGECALESELSLPNLGFRPSNAQSAIPHNNTAFPSTSSHFQRSYTALDKKASEYEQRYQQMSHNIAHKYPNPGAHRERQGNVGGSWRHIREVLGYTGTQVVFVDGRVRLQEGDYPKHLAQPFRGPTTPLYDTGTTGCLTSRSSCYDKMPELSQRQRSAYTPSWADSQQSAAPYLKEPARPPSNRYRGFYKYQD